MLHPEDPHQVNTLDDRPRNNVLRIGRRIVGILAIEAVVVLLVATAAVHAWNRSPVFRYSVLGDDASLREALKTLRRGDSIDDVRDMMGEKHLDRHSEYSVRRGLQQLVATHPEVFLQGYEESDQILVYSTRVRRYGLQFRYSRLVGCCSQTGPPIQRPADDRTEVHQ
jgi:hypothetical protein